MRKIGAVSLGEGDAGARLAGSEVGDVQNRRLDLIGHAAADAGGADGSVDDLDDVVARLRATVPTRR